MPNGAALDRRDLLRSALLLVGASAAGLPSIAFAQGSPASPRFFSPAEFALLDEIAETIIPRTDTPGARDALVAAHFDALMADWASADRQAAYRGAIADIDRAAGGFLAQSPTRRLEALTAYDAASMYGASGDTPYRRFKELVLTLYYLSEPGATQELRYELSPGKWEAWVPVTPETRAWAV